MGPAIRIYDGAQLQAVDWPDGPRAQLVRRFLAPLMVHGPHVYIDNVRADMRLLVIDGQILPLVVPEDGRPGECSNVCSPYTHYVRYGLDELEKWDNPALERLVGASLGALGKVLSDRRIEEVVYVNNWLLSTNPLPELSTEQIRHVTEFLVARFPSRAIVFRSVERFRHAPLLAALARNGYRMATSRKVYYVPPPEPYGPCKDNLRLDRKLLASTPYEVIDQSRLGPADAPRLTELYRQLYLDKYSLCNPHFNDAFFEHVTRCDGVTVKAVRKDGRIDGFIGYFVLDGITIGLVIGYDLEQPRRLGLYRMCVGLLTEGARQAGALMHLSAGAGAFKMHRGALPAPEYDAVYDRHLSSSRRFAWRILRTVFSDRLMMRIPD